ncbi:penicillin acylase family protein [Lysobacter sp. TY2-98]|uniref:penicillin acylase family protein n=1 Tax=Lysobacter sp. TY2-98 TaxID=2290922 RepID=UPI000E20A801|nr:penicillin acylase family protein [Lysobacter sp. TY2-98]AXK72035.1 penicillin acylase family protein [Lysobacter sp. TY2-98]
MKRWIRWIARLAVALVVLVAVVAAGIWFAMRGSVPRMDGRVALPGLSAPVTIQRDALGVVTIDAANEADAMRALGYVHGQERYFEMDLMRRVAAGELSELFGMRAFPMDAKHRQDRLRARVASHLDAALGERRSVVEAYVAGVNTGAHSLKVRPWPYLLLRQSPRKWAIEDTPLVGYAMYYDLQDATGARELALSRVLPTLPAPLQTLVRHDGSSWDAPLEGEPRGDATLPTAAQIDLRRWATQAKRIEPLTPKQEVGSNNFAVAGALTHDGRAILADDMHLGLRVPDIWLRARLRYADARAPGGRVDVTGFTLPGLPGVIVGSNTHVAWGFTNSYGDWLDWVVVPNCHRASCPAARKVRERVLPNATVVVYDTPWGPIDHFDAQDRALARRWVAHLPGALNLGLLDMATAGSIDDAMRVADRTAIPAQNLLLADRSGRIAWRLLGPVPQRAPGCEAAGVSDGATCPPWSFSTAGAPAVIDPASGRAWSANARVTDGDDLHRIGDGGYVLAVRARRIRDDLMAKQQFNERDLLAIQLDDRSVFLQRWATLLHEAASRSPKDSPLRALDLRPLEPRASADAVQYRLVRAWRQSVLDRVREGLLMPARIALGADADMPELPQLEGVAWPLVTQRPANLLNPRFASWDALFDDAAAHVRDSLGKKGPLRDRTWGERNTAAICHPLAAALPFARRLLCMPMEPLDGDGLTPRAVAPDFGASQRMVVAPGHEADGIAHVPGGPTGNPASPYWGAGHDDWVHGRPTPFLPGATTHRMTLEPAR